jgi:hypothetical protein
MMTRGAVLTDLPEYPFMIRCPHARSVAVVALFITIGCPPWADADNGFRLEPGFRSLFNGKDLTGWKFKNVDLKGETETANRRFQVRDGIIVANEGRGIDDLYTVRAFDRDFHLKLEFRAAPRADSGVYIRGLQLQVRDYPTVGPYKPKNFKSGDWNELEIKVHGRSALCTCNGETLEKALRVPATGGIGLQAETGKFEFRRIRLADLP